MGNTITVNIEGVPTTIANINSFNQEAVKTAKSIIRRNALAIGREGRKNAPNRTGRLRSSIGTKTYQQGLYATVGPNWRKAPHAAFFVNGTAQRFRKNGGSTGHLQANDYMQEAEDKYRGRYEQEMIAAFNRDVEV
jgi:hypothetical protein